MSQLTKTMKFLNHIINQIIKLPVDLDFNQKLFNAWLIVLGEKKKNNNKNYGKSSKLFIDRGVRNEKSA